MFSAVCSGYDVVSPGVPAPSVDNEGIQRLDNARGSRATAISRIYLTVLISRMTSQISGCLPKNLRIFYRSRGKL